MQLSPEKKHLPFQPQVLLLAAELWLQAVSSGPSSAAPWGGADGTWQERNNHDVVFASSASPGAWKFSLAWINVQQLSSLLRV